MSTQGNKKREFTLFIQGVRCFKEKTELRIRPLTFLTGENSTGKSTVLGCMSVLQDVTSFDPIGVPSFDFNREPYQMGSFNNIARRGNDSFCLEGIFPLGNPHAILKATATFRKEKYGSEPVLTSQKYQLEYKGKKASLMGSYGDARASMLREQSRSHPLYAKDFPPKFIDLLKGIYPEEIQQKKLPRRAVAEKIRDRQEIFFRLGEIEVDIRKYLGAYHESVGPIRAEPKRTYDPIRSQPTPQGDEIPVMLRNLQRESEATNSDIWLRLKEGIEQFGQKAGMFDRIEVRRLGKSDIDPFQIYIRVPGMPKANLIDVGYGVNQVLPLLVRVLTPRGLVALRLGSCFLLQQPEVHLHPQGQAALTSFFIKHISSQNHRFVIETHSDHIIDRARIEVRRGNIAPEDVSIIYLESKRGSVTAHNLTLDAQGDLEDVPNGYRSFFLEESGRMLGFDD